MNRPQVYRRRRIVVFGSVGVLFLLVAYALTMVFAPVPAAAAAVTGTTKITAPAAQLAWPTFGSAAVSAVGYTGPLASSGSDDSVPIASITKTITALVVLNAKPIPTGQEGPTITFTAADVKIFHEVVAEGGSWAPAVAGARLTEKQALEAMLLPSANNYAISLANWAYGSMDKYVAAANTWLKARHLNGTHLVDASGISPHSVSTPTDLLAIGKLVLADPILSTIVSTTEATLPGAGHQENTNKLLGTLGIDGIKTGNTDEAGDCLLFSADATVGAHRITIVGVVLGAPSHDALWAAVQALLVSTQAGFHDIAVATPGKPFGHYETVWGAGAKMVTAKKTSVLVWSNTPIAVTITSRPVDSGGEGQPVGQVSFRVGGTTVSQPLVLAKPVPGPGFWWRVSHPTELG